VTCRTTYLVAVLINIVLIASIFESETDALQRVFANRFLGKWYFDFIAVSSIAVVYVTSFPAVFLDILLYVRFGIITVLFRTAVLINISCAIWIVIFTR